MRVSYNWLKDFVDIKESAESIAEKLTMAGLEVKAIDKANGDSVFEIEITSNRPDWLSIIGVAREIGAITGKKSKIVSKCQSVKVSEKKQEKPLIIKIEDKKACPLYTACLIQGIKVGPSPRWLKERLEAIGIRSINNIVDITNYVLIETGQPLHAFDADKLNLPIIIRRAKDNEEIQLIDGSSRKLTKDMLVIADSKKPIALAGVMGGLGSEVTEQTKNILLESAYFDPILTRNTAKKLALSTDSSYRFERSVDINMVEQVSQHAAKLILELAGGNTVDFKKTAKISPKKIIVNFDLGLSNKLLGINLAVKQAKVMLSNLGLGVKEKNHKLILTIPSFRQDLKAQEDIVEEIARVYGYYQIKETMPYISPKESVNLIYDFENYVRNTLVGLGLSEVKTYSLISQALLDKSCSDKSQAEVQTLQNPLSLEFQFLRPTLLASLLDCAAYNINHKNHNFRFFEISNLFLEKETSFLGIIICGNEIVCSNQQKIVFENNFYFLKGVIENLLGKLKITDVNLSDSGEIICDRTKIGVCREIDSQIANNFDIKIKNNLFYAEICLEDLVKLANKDIKYKPYCIFPAISRDISVNIKESVKFSELSDVIKNNAGKDLVSVQLIDVYRGTNIPPEHKNFTFSLTWQSDNRTLEEKEVEQIHKNICAKLTEQLSVQIR